MKKWTLQNRKKMNIGGEQIAKSQDNMQRIINYNEQDEPIRYKTNNQNHEIQYNTKINQNHTSKVTKKAKIT